MSVANDPPFSPGTLAIEVEWLMESSGPPCAQSEDLDYLGHINTPSNARDWDLIRNLTGYEEMDCWGLGLGTMLSTTYAAMFPDHVGRIILDGTLKERSLLMRSI